MKIKKNIFENINSLSTRVIINDAIRRNIKIDHINYYQKENTFLELSFKNHFEYVLDQKSSKTFVTANYAVNNKALTKSLLDRKNINIAEGKLFHKSKINEAYKFIKKIGYPVVIKINNGSRGNLVFIGVNNKKDCEKAIGCILKENNYILIEKEFRGRELRFIASRKKVFAVTRRESANVVGDGVHNIKELIKIKNSDRRKIAIEEKNLFKIKINNVLRKKLKENNLSLNSIIIKEKKVYLRDDYHKNAMIINGGDDVDITDQVHPELKKIAVKAVQAIHGLAYAGVDLMSNRDVSKKPTKNSYIIIELNSSPAIYPQHFPHQGKSRNVAKGIIDILFPETKGKYIEK